MKDLVLNEFQHTRLSSDARDFMGLSQTDLQEAIATLQIPTLILTGSDDVTTRLCQIAADFSSANIMIQLHEDLFLARWQKLICNIPFSGLSVILDSAIEELIQNTDVRTLIEQLMTEIVAAAAAYDHQIPEFYIQKRLEQTATMKHYQTSMKVDFDHGRSLELEAIFGNPLRKAWQAGVQMPQVSMLYRQLKFFDAQNRLSESMPLSQ